MLTDFRNSFSDKLSSKFATKVSSNIPGKLKRFATHLWILEFKI